MSETAELLAAESTAEVSDEVLVQRYRDQGDQAAFAQLVHRYERPLYSYLNRYLGDATAAEDVFQQTFVQLLRKSETFEEGRKFRPWLYSVATHLAIDAMRRAGRQRAQSLERKGNSPDGEDEGQSDLRSLLEDDTPSPLAQLEERERRDWVRKAIDELPDELRSIVILNFYQGMKYREVADALGIPLGTVKSRLHKAVALLNKAWKRGVMADRRSEAAEARNA